MIEWLLVFLVLLIILILFFRKQLSNALSKTLGYRPIPLTSESFEQDIEDGLTSSNFDVTQNLIDGDTRPGLDSDEIRQIMRKKGVSFDKARLIRQEQKLRENGIDPKTGLPLDPKAVYFGDGPSTSTISRLRRSIFGRWF